MVDLGEVQVTVYKRIITRKSCDFDLMVTSGNVQHQAVSVRLSRDLDQDNAPSPSPHPLHP